MESSEYGMMVGEDCQAVIPDLKTSPCVDEELGKLIFSPFHQEEFPSEESIRQFIEVNVAEKKKCTTYQAYGVLFANKFDIETAEEDLDVFKSDWAWSDEEVKIIVDFLAQRKRRRSTQFDPIPVLELHCNLPKKSLAEILDMICILQPEEFE